MKTQKSREWLIEHQLKKGLSQIEAAKLCGISRQYYNFILRGIRTPSTDLAQYMGEVLDIDWTLFYPKRNKSSNTSRV